MAASLIPLDHVIIHLLTLQGNYHLLTELLTELDVAAAFKSGHIHFNLHQSSMLLLLS